MEKLESMINKICEDIPEGWEINLSIERGLVFVTLFSSDPVDYELPDSFGKTLIEQLKNALSVAHSSAAIMNEKRAKKLACAHESWGITGEPPFERYCKDCGTHELDLRNENVPET